MIIAVAIRDDDGRVWSLPQPARHSDVLREMRLWGKEGSYLLGQGFLTSEGDWVGREEAARIAKAAGQVHVLEHPPRLYSEDLW